MPSTCSRSGWASSSRPLAAFVALALLGGAGATLRADGPEPTAQPAAFEKVYLTVEEALVLAFPGCTIEKATVYLTDEQRERARELCGADVELKIARPYVAKKDGAVVGTAYVDLHRVRALKETLLVAIDAEGRVSRIELLAFGEPVEYVPKAEWYAQFVGRKLDDELNLKRSIRGIAGASLSARATTDAVRRVLAVHLALNEPEPEEQCP